MFGSDRSPRSQDVVCACARDIMLTMALKEFLQHSKESRGGSRARTSKQAGKQASRKARKETGKQVSRQALRGH